MSPVLAGRRFGRRQFPGKLVGQRAGPGWRAEAIFRWCWPAYKLARVGCAIEDAFYFSEVLEGGEEQ